MREVLKMGCWGVSEVVLTGLCQVLDLVEAAGIEYAPTDCNIYKYQIDMGFSVCFGTVLGRSGLSGSNLHDTDTRRRGFVYQL